MSVGVGPNGDVVVGSSEDGAYIRPSVRPLVKSDETVADGVGGHGEQKVLGKMMEMGHTSGTISAGGPVCTMCAEDIEDNGFIIGSPLKSYR
jgi:hypothetical protein